MKTRTLITTEIKNNIVKYYNEGHTIKETAKYLKLGELTVFKYLKNAKDRNRRKTRPKPIYTIDETFFEKIDTHQKAQILGMIYADGCLMKNGKTSVDAWILTIGLKSSDIKYLEQVKEITKSNRPLRTEYRTMIDKPTYKIHIKGQEPFSSWITCNHKICTDIQKLGIHQRKSFTCKFPTPDQVPDEFLNSFILGCFEGDGTFCFQENRFEANFSFIGNNEFNIEFKNKILNILDIHMSFVKRTATPEMSDISIAGNKQVIKFMDWLYKDSTENLRLERKYNNYINFKEKYYNKKEIDKLPETRLKITLKARETRKKFNGKKHRDFYIKDYNGNIYFSNKIIQFFKKYKLTPCHASKLLNGKRNEYIGWTIPSEEEIQIKKNRNQIINEIFEDVPSKQSIRYTNFYLKSEDNKIYFFKDKKHYYKYFNEIKYQSLNLLIRTKKPIRSSKWTYPTNQEIEQAKQNNEIITLE